MTHARIFGHLVTVSVGAFTLLGLPMAGVAAAQDRPALAVEFAAGWVGFADDGGGLFQTREHFLSGTFTSNEGSFTAGRGVGAFVGDRVTIDVDTRVGWELHVRVNGLIGLQLGR